VKGGRSMTMPGRGAEGVFKIAIEGLDIPAHVIQLGDFRGRKRGVEIDVHPFLIITDSSSLPRKWEIGERPLFHSFLAPDSGVVEYSEPRGGLQRELPGFGHPGPLPLQECSLRMRHQRQVPSIRRAERRDAESRTIGVEGILFRGHVLVINEVAWCKLLLLQLVQNLGIGTVQATLSMVHPDSQD